MGKYYRAKRNSVFRERKMHITDTLQVYTPDRCQQICQIAAFSYTETSIHRFSWGSEKNDGYRKTIDARAYIKIIQTIRFAYMYLLNQKM
jgi:hypothetical protein